MAGMTNTHENTLLNHMFGGATYTNPANWHVALYTSAPDDNGGGTECSGVGYARKQISNTSGAGVWNTATSGQKTLLAAISFTEAGTNWGQITHVGLSDSGTFGTPIQFYAQLDTAQAINAGDIFRIPAGAAGLRILLD
jgi:hypothetical protein